MRTMFSRYFPFAFDRQLFLADLTEDLDWAYDLEIGVLSFGDRY